MILATGSLARVSCPASRSTARDVLSSDHVLELDEVPARIAVVGGGAIGCEFASFLVDVGSEVTMLEALPQILPGVDQQAARPVVRAFTKRGIKVRHRRHDRRPRPRASLAVRYKTGERRRTVEVDKVVVSVGRRPRSEDIGLEGAGVKVDERGSSSSTATCARASTASTRSATSSQGPQLAHVGFSEAIVAIKTMLGEDAVPIDYDKVPWGIYCHPEVAFCGLTEARAVERGYDVETSVHRFGGNGRALIMGETDGMVKIVAEQRRSAARRAHRRARGRPS